MNKNFKLFCFGFGQVAKYFITNLKKKNCNFKFVTTNTSKTETKKFNNLEYKSYYFLDNKFDNNLLNELTSSNKVLISIPPKNQKDMILKTFENFFRSTNFDWVTYLSATSVYGDKKGGWVDEKSNTEPTSARGIDRLNAENQWIKYFNDFNLPVQIFRLSGIYSAENNAITKLKMGNLKIIEKKNHFFSRIHVEDIAEILALSLNNLSPGQVFNITDNYPCSNVEVAEYAANLLKTDLPQKIKIDDVNNEQLRDFYRDSKKVSNKKMINFFKYDLKYPTFREGLRAIKNHII